MIIERESTKTWSILVIKIMKNESWNLVTKGFYAENSMAKPKKSTSLGWKNKANIDFNK